MGSKQKQYGAKDIFFIPFRYAPKSAFMVFILNILFGLVPTLNMLAVAKFINDTISIVKNNLNISSITTSIVFIIACNMYIWFEPHIVKIEETKLENELRTNFKISLIEKVGSLKYNYIENQDSWDLISRVIKKPEEQCRKAFSDLNDLITSILSISGVLIVLLFKAWWTAIAIVLVSIPLLKLSIKAGKANYEADRRVEKYNRRVKYLSEVLNGRDAANERTLFKYTKKVNDVWHDEYEKARKIQFKVKGKWFIKAKSSGIIIAILSTIIMLILVFPVKSGKLSIGLFISITNNILLLIQILSWQLPNATDALAKNKEYLVDLNNLLNLESKEEYLNVPSTNFIKVNTIEFKHVYFKYPQMKQYILKDMNFKLESGKHYAFVGTNGAGKTTITKLLTGLYEDFEGEILINDISIKNYTQAQLKSIFSIVYQDFAKYFVSVEENIMFGDINNRDLEKMNNALEVINLKDEIYNLNNGIKSNLGKIRENGVDLSGGQWQRLAMARSIVSNKSFLILDEPTASLDPISESNIYEKFQEISKGQTALFISHRLGSTKIADEILVIDDGKVLEKGSYSELMKLNGIYAKMFESQRSWYL